MSRTLSDILSLHCGKIQALVIIKSSTEKYESQVMPTDVSDALGFIGNLGLC
jgi:hypothetical protein